MTAQIFVNEPGLREKWIARGVVTAVDGDRVTVRIQAGDREWLVVTDVLVASEAPVRLRPDDRVLCSFDEDDRTRGIVLGRIGASRGSPAEGETGEGALATAPAQPDITDTLIIEAKRSITLRVGDGSITIRRDGKILIKGKDLVSHAKRLNRIRGGSVAIN